MRMIDADPLMERVRCGRKCEECDFYTDGDSWCNGEVYGTTIMQAPTIDAVPRSMLDAAIADISHTCPTCKHNRKDGCALLEKCVKENFWEWRGANE